MIDPHEVKKLLARHLLTEGFDLIVDLEKSRGSWLVDQRNGARYLDFFSMFASMSIGYNHPRLVAVTDQLGRMAVQKPSNSDVYTVAMAEFMDVFSQIGIPDGFPHAFLIEGGALAVENALKAAFEEVENIDVLQKVAKQPPLEGVPYQAILLEGRDSRGIDVGYLLRTDRAEALTYTLRLDDNGLFTRGPLLLKSRIHTADGALTLYTLANHFASMGAGFEATEPRRAQQAQWNLDIAREIQAQDPQALIAILGDFS